MIGFRFQPDFWIFCGNQQTSTTHGAKIRTSTAVKNQKSKRNRKLYLRDSNWNHENTIMGMRVTRKGWVMGITTRELVDGDGLDQYSLQLLNYFDWLNKTIANSVADDGGGTLSFPSRNNHFRHANTTLQNKIDYKWTSLSKTQRPDDDGTQSIILLIRDLNSRSASDQLLN